MARDERTLGEFAPDALMSKEQCKALFDNIIGLSSGGGQTTIAIKNRWTGSAKWARNRMEISTDMSNTSVWIHRVIRGAAAIVTTTDLDDDGLRAAVQRVEKTLLLGDESLEQFSDPFNDEPILHPKLWSDATFDFTPAARTALVQDMIAPAETAGLLAAGSLVFKADSNATIGSNGLFRYFPTTEVECSITTRDTKGTASGWAGVNQSDFSRIDPKALAALALDKCQQSMNPRAVEPGRYTAILEPQATADLLWPLLQPQPMSRPLAEMPAGPFGGKERGRSRITEQVLDRRLIVRADPEEPDGSFLPYDPFGGVPYQKATWIDAGILTDLAYPKSYALAALHRDRSLLSPKSFYLGPTPGTATSTVDEMISRTRRGLLVTRFHDVHMLDFKSMLCTGYTRDGLWFIENGKISKPVKNFYFTESPLFVLNKLLDVGVPQRVFSPDNAWMAPAVRVQDFSFRSLADAV